MQSRNGMVPRARQLARSGNELSRAAQRRLDWMSYCRTHGRNAALTCPHFGIGRQTFYRWKRRFDPRDLSTLEDRSHRPQHRRLPTWTPEVAQRVLHLWQQFPRWGKDKLVVLLRDQGLRLSTSMVGRILTSLKRRGALHEPPRPAVARARRRRLRHRPWAIRKPKHWRIDKPGDLVELDTKELRPVRGVVLKHFSARDVISRWDVVQVQQRATAARALGVTNVQFETSDAATVEIPGRLNAIYLVDLLHHVPVAVGDRLIGTFYERLDPGGRLIIKEITTHPRYKVYYTFVLDCLVAPHDRYYYRNSAIWHDLLTRTEFDSIQSYPLKNYMPYPHFLMIGRKPAGDPAAARR